MTIDFSLAREKMVEQQIRPWDVTDLQVLDVLTRVPREAFVPEPYRTLAYADLEIPLSNRQTMMKPVIEGRMLQALMLSPEEDVLEIGTGSGFITACLAFMGHEVVSLEIDSALAASARTHMDTIGLGSNLHIEHANVFAWHPQRHFNVICLTGAVNKLPLQLMQWLHPNGRMFAIHGNSPVMQAVMVRGDTSTPHIMSLFETDLAYLTGAEPSPQFQF
ncbi:MAG TPA: protein-L-isoaspartate O-methyltransferase family protein [Xylella sp.]